MIYILADDLTGASDTGIQYKNAGYETLVKVYNDDNLDSDKKYEVVAVNLDTRSMSEKDAYKKTAEYIKNLKDFKFKYIYKKVDSLMRGNPAIELEATMNELQAEIAIVAPSFPENDRILEHGILRLLDGRSVDVTKLFQDKMTRKVKNIDINIIQEGPSKIKDEIYKYYEQGYGVFVMDVLEDCDLENIKIACDDIDLKKIYCGSAGLAKHLSLTSNKKIEKTRIKRNHVPILLIVGTRSEKTRIQVERLVADEKNELIEIDTNEIITNNSVIVKEEVVKRAKDQLANGEDLIILAVSGLFEEYLMSLNISKEEAKDSLIIAEALGEISREILEESKIKTIISTGGDTSLQVCRYLNAKGIQLYEEVLPGVPLGKIILDENLNLNLNIVTKSGSFGEDDTLIKIISYLKGDDVCE